MNAVLLVLGVALATFVGNTSAEATTTLAENASAEAVTTLASSTSANALTPADAQQIAKEAYIYGLPLVESYQALYAEAVDEAGKRFEAPLDTLKSEARLYAPGAKDVETPNLDVARSSAWLDLRTQPVILGVPEIEEGRYYSIQLVDLYNSNFATLGTRTTGNGAARILIAGPRWRGEKPEGVTRIIRAETDFVRAIYRTQIFDAGDLDRVRAIQGQYTVQSLNEFQAEPLSATTTKVKLRRVDPSSQRGLGFLAALDFLLQFTALNEAETEQRARLARIGVGAGEGFDKGHWTAPLRKALSDGLAEGRAAVETAAAAATPADLIGGSPLLGGDALKRAVRARRGLHRISPEESLQRLYVTDAEGKPLDGSDSQYVLNLSGTNLPPAEAFWSITAYDSKNEGLVASPIDRFRIDSRMLHDLKADAGGGLSLYIQRESPGADKEANWLPAPDGSFYLVMRLYWPKQEAVDGSWKAPPIFAERLAQKPVATPSGVEPTQEVTPLQASEETQPELERPTAWGEPTEVRVAIYVMDVDQVSSAQQSFAASIYYEARWNSPFLRHKGPGPLRRNITEVWTPRLTIVGQQNVWSGFPEAVEIQPDGDVVYRQKVWGHFSQPLNLRDFPLDRQKLEIHIVAVGLLEEHVQMVPLERTDGRKSGIAQSFSVADFDVTSWKAEPAAYFPYPGEHGTAGFRMRIEIKRQVGYYATKVIIPLCLIVIMSWLPRWIDPKETGPNIGISTTAFLTLVAYLFAITVLLPPVSYITRIDRFILLSTLMVFTSLVQTIANTALVRRGSVDLAERIDRRSRIAYPVVLLIVLFVSFAG